MNETVSLMSSLIVFTTLSLFLCIIIVIERYDFRFSLNRKALEVRVCI